MQIEFRLKQVLGEIGQDGHGVIKKIADDLGVHRQTIAKLYRNQAESVTFSLLGGLCDWLIAHGVPAETLPGALLSPAQIWQQIARCTTVRMYLGEFRPKRPLERYPRPWIARSDSSVAAGIVGLLSSSHHAPTITTEYVRFRLLSDDGQDPLVADDQRAAGALFNSLRAGDTTRTTSILIGSQKVNLVLEYLVADLFGASPFEPPTDVPLVPFYMAYRHDDHYALSCFGGRHAPPAFPGKASPGIYTLDEQGAWTHAPWIDGRTDAGLVITVLHERQESLEVALLGYSAPATETVGSEILRNPDEFWPPMATVHGRRIGVYVCSLSYQAAQDAQMGQSTDKTVCTVKPLSTDIIEKYAIRDAR